MPQPSIEPPDPARSVPCPNCGTVLLIDAQSCSKCGANFGAGSAWRLNAEGKSAAEEAGKSDAVTTDKVPKTLALIAVIISFVVTVSRCAWTEAENKNKDSQQMSKLARGSDIQTSVLELGVMTAKFEESAQRARSGALIESDCSPGDSIYSIFLYKRNESVRQLDAAMITITQDQYIAVNSQIIEMAMRAADAFEYTSQICAKSQEIKGGGQVNPDDIMTPKPSPPR